MLVCWVAMADIFRTDDDKKMGNDSMVSKSFFFENCEGE